MRVVLARAARSARLTTHFDLDFPRAPQREPYWCHKHKRECRPVDRAEHFLRRYALDTLKRIKEFARVRARGRDATVLHGDARELEWGEGSTPSSRRRRTRGSSTTTSSTATRTSCWASTTGASESSERPRRARAAPRSTRIVQGVAEVLARAADALRPGAPVLVVVNDRRDLYPEILERAGLRLEQRLRRHVNRRTGRRAGEYFEDVLVLR